jgi:hypothetical protein
MKFPACNLRQCFDEEKSLFFCAHPGVHTLDGMIQPAYCHMCTIRTGPEPAIRRTSPSRFCDGTRLMPALSKVAIVIPCHNYGHFLAEAIESALNQTVSPTEIIVIDDDSDDNAQEVTARYQSQGVRLLRITSRNVHEARRAGFHSTLSPVLCFLDADDRLAPDYLECGLPQFRTGQNTGIVHSDLQCFGTSENRIDFPDIVDRSMMSADNRIHAGSLVRRDALALSGAFDTELAPEISRLTGDWWIWKSVLDSGWKSVRQSATYHYRRHPESSLHVTSLRKNYFRTAHLDREVVTLFIPLSGRRGLWSAMSEFLQSQQWPHHQIRLVLMDTSHDQEFFSDVRAWIAGCDYPDVRHFRNHVGEPGLADFPRMDAVNAVRRSMARIYNFLARNIETPFVWVLEDDVFPPADTCEQLLRSFDAKTGSVAAPYRSRYHEEFVVWDNYGRSSMQKGQGVTTVGGNGFGCVVLRSEILSQQVFAASAPHPDFDKEFYARLLVTEWTSKVNWDLEAEHRSDGVRQSQFTLAGMSEEMPR